MKRLLIYSVIALMITSCTKKTVPDDMNWMAYSRTSNTSPDSGYSFLMATAGNTETMANLPMVAYQPKSRMDSIQFKLERWVTAYSRITNGQPVPVTVPLTYNLHDSVYDQNRVIFSYLYSNQYSKPVAAGKQVTDTLQVLNDYTTVSTLTIGKDGSVWPDYIGQGQVSYYSHPMETVTSTEAGVTITTRYTDSLKLSVTYYWSFP